jgi:hypothetical protein
MRLVLCAADVLNIMQLGVAVIASIVCVEFCVTWYLFFEFLNRARTFLRNVSRTFIPTGNALALDHDTGVLI